MTFARANHAAQPDTRIPQLISFGDSRDFPCPFFSSPPIYLVYLPDRSLLVDMYSNWNDFPMSAAGGDEDESAEHMPMGDSITSLATLKPDMSQSFVDGPTLPMDPYGPVSMPLFPALAAMAWTPTLSNGC